MISLTLLAIASRDARVFIDTPRRRPRWTSAFALLLIVAMAGPVSAEAAVDRSSSPTRAMAASHVVADTAVNSPFVSALQVDAPPENAGSPTLIERAEFPYVFALALDQPLTDPDAGRAITLQLTPLAFASLFGARPVVGTHLNRRFVALSRVGMSATLGGPTQADDATRALRPRSITNHFTAELRLGVIGDVDRAGSTEAGTPRGPIRAASLSLIADTYATGFGRDLYAATIIVESRRPLSLTTNFGYRREERIHDRRREELAVGAGIGGPRISLFGRPVFSALSCEELIRNLGRTSVFQANSQLDVPLSHRLCFTTAMTWANHAERYAKRGLRASAGFGLALR
jgi:hypothetical protein